MFESVIEDSQLTISSVSLCVIVAIVLGLFIAFIHTKTATYSKSFIVTLSILPLLVSVVIMMVNGDLGTSIAIAGAFALTKFRSLPGTSREIASIFWAMTIGLAVGMGQIYFAIMIAIVVSLLLILFKTTKFGNPNESERLLKIVVPEDLDYKTTLSKIMNKYTDTYEMIRVRTIDMGSLFELSYNLKLKPNIKEQTFINELRVHNGNLKIDLSVPLKEDVL